jgi:diaminopimelate decarboxylase
MTSIDPALLNALQQLLNQDDQPLYRGELTALVEEILENRARYLEAARRFGTPQYLFEEPRLQAQIHRFTAAFARPGLVARAHYAFKANPSLCLVQAIQRAGLAADASSGLELELALRCGFERVVLSGPAKTDEELELALSRAGQVTVHLDSFAEMERLEALAARRQTTVRAGVRLNTQGHGLWTKFGIPFTALPDLVALAARQPHVQLEGVQFHLSWNRQAAGYLRTLAELGPVLARCAPPAGWRFADIGGGYYPEDDEAAYPWLTRRGRLLGLLGLAPAEGPPPDWDLGYLLHPVQPIEAMAREIMDAFQAHLPKGLEMWLEPGRYLANPAVQLLLRVIDVKTPELAITDGGTNLLGWERLEGEHCPLINLSQPSLVQKPCRVYGSLCTPHDLWGYACYGEGLNPGDLLLLPAQGAYVQTLAQRFIKPLCQTVALDVQGEMRQVAPPETLADRYPQLFQ